MADAKLTALTAADALAAADLFYVSQSAASRKATGTQLLALVGTAYVPLAGGTMTGALTIASGTLTASAPALNITQTWNAGAVTFTSALFNITKTAAATDSKFLDFQIAGVSKASLEYDASSIPVLRVGSSATTGRITTYQVDCQQILPNEINVGGYNDIIIRRFSAGKAVMRVGATPQSLLICNAYTDASNYEGLALSGVAGTSVNITAETLGTGGDNLHLVLQSAGTGLIKFYLNGAQRAYIDTDGYYTGIGIVGTGGKFILSDSLDLRMDPTLGVKWTASGGYSGTVDSGLMRGAAGQVDVTNGTAATYRDLKLRNLLSTGYATINSGTLTASAPALNISQTWNGSGVSFRAIDISITNTLSALSYPIVVTIGATNIFYLSSSGDLYANNFRTTTNSGSYGIGSDTILYRDAAASLALRNGTAQQSFSVYNSESSGLTNYERLKLTGVAGTSVNITAETLGTGGDNLDIVLTPAGNGSVVFPNSTYITSTGFGILSGIKCGTESSLNYYASGMRILSSGEIAWTNTTLVNAPVDTALFRDSAGVVKVTDGGANYRDLKLRNLLAGGGNGSYVQTPSMTVANLAAAATAGAGARAFVTDANATTFLSTVAAGGANKVPVVSDGTNWLIG